jgi:sugar phosphate isomerase/epimerase
MPIELGIATPAVPRDPRALDDRFGKWAADLGITVVGTHLGPTPEDVAPYAEEVRERLAGWGITVVQATGYNPVMVGDNPDRRAADLDRLTCAFQLARQLGSPMVLTGSPTTTAPTRATTLPRPVRGSSISCGWPPRMPRMPASFWRSSVTS